MATRLTLLVRIAAVMPLVGGVVAIVGAVQTLAEWRAGPGFGTGPIFAAGLAFGGVVLGLVPSLVLWRAASAVRDSGQELHASSGRGRAMAAVMTAVVIVGWLAGGILILAAGRADAVVFAGYLGIGLISVTSAWTARFVPEGGLARALLYVSVIFAILAGMLAWVFAGG
jgi:hypothetical protein